MPSHVYKANASDEMRADPAAAGRTQLNIRDKNPMPDVRRLIEGLPSSQRRGATLLGIEDPWVLLAYLLSFIVAAGCIAYGLLNWNEGGDD